MSGEWETVLGDTYKSSAIEMYTIKSVGPDGALKVTEVVEFVDSVAAKNIMVMLKTMKEKDLSPEEAARILVQ
jgi:hypothetical protein